MPFEFREAWTRGFIFVKLEPGFGCSQEAKSLDTDLESVRKTANIEIGCKFMLSHAEDQRSDL